MQQIESEQDTRLPIGKLLRHSWYITSFARTIFFLSIATMIFSSLLGMLVPLLLSDITKKIQALAPTSSTAENSPLFFSFLPDSAAVFGFAFLILVLASVGLSFMASWTHSLASLRITKSLQQILHDKILKLGPDFHRQKDLGETTAIVMNFASGAQQTFCGIYTTLLVDSFSLFFSIWMIIGQLNSATSIPLGWKLCLAAMILLFPILGVAMSQRMQRNSSRLNKGYIATQKEYINSGTNPLEVQVMGAGKQRSESFGKALHVQYGNQVKAALLNIIVSSLDRGAGPLLQAIFIITMIFNLGDDPAKYTNAVGAIIIFIMLIPNAIRPIQSLVSMYTGLKINWPMVSYVVDVIEKPIFASEDPGSQNYPVDGRTVEAKDLTFAYTPDNKPILNDFSHHFQPGKITAVAAKLGMGKSTFLNLLLRLYQPQSGVITIDGVDIQSINTAELRRKVIRISQFPLFITDTLRNNFLLAKANATDEEIMAACRQTGFWQDTLQKKIEGQSCPNPLDLEFRRESGADWTGGERKVLALTRALLLKPRVLLIDEPSSGVDAFKAKQIALLLKSGLFQETTIILVDHNTDFLREVCDEIVCIDEGKIVDVGSPADLLARNSFFRQLSDSFDGDYHEKTNTGLHPEKEKK